MNKLFLCLMFVLIFSSLIFAQQQDGWEFESMVINGYTVATDQGQDAVNIPGFKNAYSVTVDPDGKIWAGTYYARRGEFTGEYPDSLRINDTTVVTLLPIFTWDPATQTGDTISFLSLPDGGTDTLMSGHRGMKTDPDGNIIASFANGAVYKINYQTKEVIAKYETGGSNGRPGVDADGYVYQMDGVFASRIDILDPTDFSLFNQITGVSASVTRGLEVSPDGQNVFLCSYNGGVYRFHSADGAFGTYTLADTLLPNVIQGEDTLTLQANLAQWHPAGLLWVAGFEDAPPRIMFALDPDQDYAVVDSLKEFEWWGNTDMTDTTSGGYAKPKYLRCVRDAYFNAEGTEFYAAEFYGYGIKKYAIPTAIQPGQDKKVVPGAFTLYHNYPNPFNPTTTIPFELHKRAHVVLRIYDVRGSLIGTYYNQTLEPGRHEFQFDASNLATGPYYFKLTVNQKVATGKMTLVK